MFLKIENPKKAFGLAHLISSSHNDRSISTRVPIERCTPNLLNPFQLGWSGQNCSLSTWRYFFRAGKRAAGTFFIFSLFDKLSILG